MFIRNVGTSQGKKKKKKNSWPMWSGMMSQLTAGMGIFGMKDDNKDALKP